MRWMNNTGRNGFQTTEHDVFQQGHYYEDEPIRLTPQQQKTKPPKEYRKMRNLAFGSVFGRNNDAKIFYLQAKYMERFEDDCPYEGKVLCYYPTYQNLTLQELRGYFTWRTKLRRGELQKTSLSYAFLYLYELLHQIGSETAEDGFQKLLWFYEQYGALDGGIKRYAKEWILDYAMYYGLPKKCVKDFVDSEFEDALLILRSCDTAGDDELFSSISYLSAHRLDRSKAYKTHPEELKHCICAAYRRLDEQYAKRYQRPYTQKLFGKPSEVRYYPFRSAIFYPQKQIDSFTFRLSPLRIYTCKQNQWTLWRGYFSTQRSRDLGVFVRAADRLVREQYALKPALKPGKETKTMVRFLTEAIAAWQKAKKPKVEFDLSKLSGIRKSADTIGQKLLTEEERYVEETPPAPPIPEQDEDCMLTGNELRFLQLLLRGGDWKRFLSEHHLMASVLAESINEQLFDEFADTVIDFDGDTPVIVEDYLDDLKGMIHS